MILKLMSIILKIKAIALVMIIIYMEGGEHFKHIAFELAQKLSPSSKGSNIHNDENVYVKMLFRAAYIIATYQLWS